MSGAAFASSASEGWIGPPNIGLSPERIQELSEQAKVRIAAENAAKEAHKAQRAQQKAKRAQRKASVQAEKSTGVDHMDDKDESSENELNEDGNLKTQKKEKKSLFGSLKKVLKKEKEDEIVR